MKRFGRFIAMLLAVTSALCAAAIPASADSGVISYGAATVDASLLNIRSGPGMDYDIISTIGDKTIIVILERTNSEWYYINYDGIVGYAKSEYFTDILTAENFSAMGEVTATDVLMRSGPSTDKKVLGVYNTGDQLAVIGINNGWYKVKSNGSTGYMRSDYMKIISGYNPTRSASGAPTPSPTGNALVDFALQYVGYDYQYGGSSPKSGFDCSGFTTYVFKNFGVSLTRNSAGQYKNDGVKISKDELAAGDLLFFASNGKNISHVGIYMGDGEFVHASGERVGVVISRTDSTYYINHYVGAKRVSF
ncbi:MAG: C40 family peptidase [Oscillospiraceae bacterium]|nr:C40 family peptidase [Oscillospiraceae bacterium]